MKLQTIPNNIRLQEIRRHSEVRRPQPQGVRRGDALRHRELDADGRAEGDSVPAGLVALVRRDVGVRRDSESAHCCVDPRLVRDRFSAQCENLDIAVKLEQLPQRNLILDKDLHTNTRGYIIKINCAIHAHDTNSTPLGQLRTKATHRATINAPLEESFH